MNDVAQAYLDCWNATDAATRQERMARTFHAEVRHTDPVGIAQGLDELDARFAAGQQRYPDHVCTLVGEPDGHHDLVRFSWSLATHEAAPVLQGTVVAVVDPDSRIRIVAGFIDPVPAA